MRLVVIEPHSRYPVMDTRSFDCVCGNNFSETVPRYWLGGLPDPAEPD